MMTPSSPASVNSGAATTELDFEVPDELVGVLGVLEAVVDQVVAGDDRRAAGVARPLMPTLTRTPTSSPGPGRPCGPSPEICAERMSPLSGSTRSSWARSPSSRSRAASTTCLRRSTGSRMAVIRAAISRRACSARARRRTSSRDWAIASMSRAFWIAIAAWWARASTSATSSGANAPVSGQPTWSTPSSPDSPVSGVTISDRTPSRRTASSRLGSCWKPSSSK